MPRKKTERERPPAGPQPNSLSIRGSLEWREWLRELAEAHRTTPTGAIDAALAELAKKIKFRTPPRRIP